MQRIESFSKKNIFVLITLVAILMCSSVFGPVFTANGAPADEGQTSEKVKRVIVQLEGSPALNDAAITKGRSVSSAQTLDKVQSLTKELQQTQRNVLSLAKDNGIEVQKRGQFSFAFNGMALEVPEEKVNELASLPGVKAIYPDQQVHINLGESVPLIRAPEVWSMQDGEGRKVTGKSVTVAVIDTGVDYTHPDLGGEFGPGNKVVGGYDFVNGDGDPMDDNGHGTHVAGIVGANGDLSGVAPDVTITAYKVLDQSGYGELSDILAGIEAAVDPENPNRADIINMSLSGPGDGSDPLSQAAQNAVDAGVVVVAAAGNEGPGSGTVGAPGAADGVLTVGASISGVTVPEMRLVTPEKKELSVENEAFSATPPAEELTAELVDVGDGAPEDYEEVDVRGKALLIESSWQNFDKARLAEEKGARAVLFHQARSAGPVSTKKGTAIHGLEGKSDSEKADVQHDFTVGASDDGRLDDLVAVSISAPTAGELKSYLAEGSAKVAIKGVDATDQIAAFSSRGPTGAFHGKPDLVAPGVEIKSTVPHTLVDSGYMRMSGTSMAAPHAAGAAALLKQLHPEWSAPDIENALTGSAKPLDSYDPLTQGAGRLDVKAAADANVVASPRIVSFALADLQNADIENQESVTLRNLGEKRATVNLTVRDNSTVKADVEISPSVVTIDPGEQVSVDVKISLDRPDQDADVMGWLEAEVETGDRESHLTIPYHLAVRGLQLHTSPDPATGDSEVFIYSPADLKQAPTVTVQTPKGKEKRFASTHDHDRWWRAEVEVDKPGIYHIQASAVSANNSSHKEVALAGSSTLEVLQNKRGTSTWQPVGPNSNGGQFTFDPRKSNKVFALNPNDSGLFVSDDEAKSWWELRNLPIAGGRPLELIFNPKNERQMYLAVNGDDIDPAYRGKLLVSNDSGKSWTSLPFPDVAISDLEMDDNGRLFSLVGDGQVYVSPDRGASWETITGPWSGSVSDTLFVGSDLFLSTNAGLYAVRDVSGGSRNPEQVFQSPKGNRMVYLAGDGNALLASEQFGNLYISYDKGKEWKQLFEPPSNIWMLRLVDGDIYLSMSGDMWVGKNYGKTWQPWESPAPSVPESDVGVSPVSSSKNRHSHYIGSERVGIFRTENNGEAYERVGIPGATLYDVALAAGKDGPVLIAGTEWDTYRTALPTERKIDAPALDWGTSVKEGYFGARATLVAPSPDHPNIVYKTVVVDPVDTFNVFRSKDGGKTWEQLTKGSETPYAILVHPANPDHIYISYWSLLGSGLLVSRDGGESWKTIGLDRPAMALAGDPDDEDRVWAGDETGLYVSENGGATFKKLQSEPVNALAIAPNNPDHLIVGGKKLYFSRNGGETLQTASYANLKFNVNDIIFSHRDSSVAYTATGSFYEAGLLKGGRGVLRSTDGGRTWHNISRGLNNLDTTSLAITANDEYLFAGTASGGVYRLKLDKAAVNKR